MRVECMDAETPKMSDGVAAPQLVCLSWSNGQERRLLVPWEGPDPLDLVEETLRREDTILLNQHIFFDLGVMCAARPSLQPLIIRALESGRLRCIKVREQLIRIALGEAKFIEESDEDGDDGDDEEEGGGGGARTKTLFDIAAIAWRWLRRRVEKKDTWRLSYALLHNVPLAHWPEKAKEYSLIDADVPLEIWAAQEAFVQANFVGGILPGETEACCAAWSLALMKIWGIRTNPEAVAALKYELQMKVLWTTIGLIMMGILRVGGTRMQPKAVETKAETQRRIEAAFLEMGAPVPYTDPSGKFPQGQIKTSKKVLEDAAHIGDINPAFKGLADSLTLLAEHKGYTKILSTYIPKYVEKGIRVPICADWNVLVESFRISCSRPNLTNPPRAGNVRDCFESRTIVTIEEVIRMVFVSADFDQAELRSWAEVCQVMFGYSTMADAFRQGIDPHLKLGAELLHISLEEAIRRYADGDKVIEDARQFSKEPNFGLIGGMGAKKFAERAALKKIKLTVDEAKKIRFAWMATWAEARPYLDYFAKHYDKPGIIVHPITGMVRGGCGYADGANHMFQHLTAIGAKQALWDLTKECYAVPSSPIFGARPVIDMHDEIIGEIDERRSAAGAMHWGAVMKTAMEKWIKRVPVKCTPVLTRRLYKGAKPIFVNGLLVPSKPLREGGRTIWVADL